MTLREALMNVLEPVGKRKDFGLARFAKASVNVDALVAQLQDKGARSIVTSCNELLAVIAAKNETLQEAK